MIKRVDRVVLGSFIVPLIITFGLTSFIFMMQFLWKYIDDFVGKGLETSLLVKLVGLFTLTIVPMALPLAILLASTMVIGSLAEDNELTAYKTGGLSLLRIMGSLIVFAIFLAGLTFYFSNNVLPKVHLRFYSLLYDIRKQKPALDIKEGIFYRGISGFALKIQHKDADNKTLYGIMVYDHSKGRGNDNVVLADKGDIALSNTGEHLILTLYNGKQYQDVTKRSMPGNTEEPEQTVMEFKKWRKVFDLKEFKMTRTDQSLFKTHFIMYNAKQLMKEADSSRKDIENKIVEIQLNNGNYISYFKQIPDSVKLKNDTVTEKIDINNVFTRNIRESCLSTAKSNLQSLKSYTDMSIGDLEYKQSNYVNYYCEWYRKFSLSFACIVLLFVGCSMGAIVRKGGFGVPILIAVLYFVLFHVLNVTGEKLAKGLIIPPFAGMWLSSLVLMPIALFLTYKANRDSVLFRSEWYGYLFNKVKSIFILKKSLSKD
ncbi:MAG TPA: LptF/LptG family permease [Chitinophagales bacterium]|nr:LptF/LptG family permease [Chitinophagales bacterium]HMW12023.1 LptF/LptG family permease [Chitinophagales bacterium]HMX59701.1 LptF/LptG family permease [Chitinophagales bacterium]HMY24222.1 LptF/LptG family permease [Chitinophagales bacterium]HMZ33112.1 LptF/LptG family permease [Chitinophagales bacterium]